MIRKYVLPLLAVAGVLFAVWTAVQSAKPIPPAKPVAEPPRPPFANKISGSGIIEASTRNIAIGTHVPGIVIRVFVKVGDGVKPGILSSFWMTGKTRPIWPCEMRRRGKQRLG